MADNEPLRNTPRDAVDAQFQLINTLWGQEGEINPDFRDRLSRDGIPTDAQGRPERDEQGNIIVTRQYLWSQLSFFTRDLKLGNLDGGMLKEATHYLDLAADCINEGYNEGAIVCLSRVARVIELSQSYKGFARKWAATLRTVTDKDDEAPKKKL